jgi:hypothetical protein
MGPFLEVAGMMEGTCVISEKLVCHLLGDLSYELTLLPLEYSLSWYRSRYGRTLYLNYRVEPSWHAPRGVDATRPELQLISNKSHRVLRRIRRRSASDRRLLVLIYSN